MSKEYKVPEIPFIIRYDGIFDFDGLYRLIQQWIMDQGYYFEEKTVKHKVPSPAGAEQDYDLSGWRKVNEYVQFTIRVYIKTYDTKNIDVIKDGKKKNLTKARLRIFVSGGIVLDYQNRFAKSRFLQALMDFYNKYILKIGEGVIGGIWIDQHYYRLLKLHALIKEHLEMDSKSNAYYDMWQ